MTELCKNPGQCHVVVVEDDQLLSMVMAMQLRSIGINFCSASNGLDALALVKSHRPKILVLDVSIPGLSGYEVVEAIRQDPSHTDIHELILIIHTSQDLTFAEQTRLTLGRTLFLTKTKVSDELGTVVKTILTGSNAEVDLVFH